METCEQRNYLLIIYPMRNVEASQESFIPTNEKPPKKNFGTTADRADMAMIDRNIEQQKDAARANEIKRLMRDGMPLDREEPPTQASERIVDPTTGLSEADIANTEAAIRNLLDEEALKDEVDTAIDNLHT